MNITISKIIPEDALGIREVLRDTWIATYPNKELGITEADIADSYKDLFTEESIKQFQERIRNFPDSIQTFVAKDGDRIMGVCRVIIEKDSNELKMLYVHPEYQGKGIGKALWEESKKLFNENNRIFVNVATYNNQAIKFYEKLGFKDTGKRFEEEKFRFKNGANIPEMEMVIEAKKL